MKSFLKIMVWLIANVLWFAGAFVISPVVIGWELFMSFVYLYLGDTDKNQQKPGAFTKWIISIRGVTDVLLP